MGDLVHAGTGTNSLGPSYSSRRECCQYVQRPGELQSLAWAMQRQDASPERLLPKCLPFVASLWSPEQAHTPSVSRHADLTFPGMVLSPEPHRMGPLPWAWPGTGHWGKVVRRSTAPTSCSPGECHVRCFLLRGSLAGSRPP